MKPTDLKAVLFDATRRAFEQVAFMFAAPGGEPSIEDRMEAVSVDISGPLAGRMVLAISAPLLPGLASNMLGDDMPLPADQQRDALGELANIIAGAVLPAIGGPDSVFRISPPVAVELAAEKCQPDLSEAVAIHAALEGGYAETLLWLK